MAIQETNSDFSHIISFVAAKDARLDQQHPQIEPQMDSIIEEQERPDWNQGREGMEAYLKRERIKAGETPVKSAHIFPVRLLNIVED